MILKRSILLLLSCSIFAAIPHAVAKGKPTRGSGIKPEVLYHNYCSVCHGDRGDGNSRAAYSLNPPPRNFLMATNFGREHMISVIRDGKPGTAMVGWGSQLNDKEISEVTDYIRNAFMKSALDPQVQRGKQVYSEKCVMCHGERGEGLPTDQMNVPPRNFAAPQARVDLTKEKMIEAVTNGRSGTMMISFREQLPKKDIEAVVAYIDAILMVPQSQISGTSAHGGREQDADQTFGKAAPVDMSAPFPRELKGNAKKGEQFYRANCAECHGDKGDGQGKRAYFINPRPADFGSSKFRTKLNRPALFTVISQGKLATEMPAWNKVLSDQEIADVAEYTFQTFIANANQKKSK